MMEARKQPRANLALRPEYFSPSETEFVDGKTHDISTGGMFIEAERMIPSGTLIKIRCEPGAGDLIEGVAKVVWNRPRTADTGPAGIGVKFIKLKGDSERVLQRLVESGIGAAAGAPESSSEAAASEPATEAATGSAAADTPAEQAAAVESSPGATGATPTARPSAAELSARLEKARASIPSPAPAGASANKPAATSEAAKTDRTAPAIEGTATKAAVPRQSEASVPRQAAPVLFVMGGLLTAIAALGAWLLLR